MQETSTAAANTPAAPAPPAAASQPAESFGQPLQAAEATDLAGLLATPERYATQRITVEGVVREVCRARGCWLELATAQSEQAGGCRVIMKDHAFFVPPHSVGRRVRVQGQAQVNTVPVAQVTHMEQEGGRFSHKQPDGSALELRIVASGVELLPSS